MNKIITFISALMLPVLTLIISIYVGKIKIIQSRQKNIIISLCVLMLIFEVITIVGRIKNEEKLDVIIEKNNELSKQQKEVQEREEYISQLLERQNLYICEGLEIPYIDSLGKDPTYKYHFNLGIRHYNNYKYAEGIDEFNKCLNVKTISLENKVTVNTFLGNCFSNVNNADKAEKYYKEALIIAKNIKDQKTSKEEVANATVEIGNVYYMNGDYVEALN
ncbi:MAG: tetratricopeptide repeat protein, partial [Bacteroidales bacterium]|nr:tetratricopeptide repeat protein [Bacteroidales bacterium]